jgi:hypothetical protein
MMQAEVAMPDRNNSKSAIVTTAVMTLAVALPSLVSADATSDLQEIKSCRRIFRRTT